MESSASAPDRDEQRLAELGYKQTLNRAWSGFSNFAISFSIISVLAGCFTGYAFAWNNGGPIAVSIGWPLVATFILIIGLSMSELVAKFPTSGGIYWWAGRLGGPAWAWFTGWFNLIGLVAVVASVDYAAAGFLNVILGLYKVNVLGVNFGDTSHILPETFGLFAVILLLTVILNIFRTHLLAVINNISVWWHVIGVAVIIGLLIFVPDHHASLGFVFGHQINNSGFNGGATGGLFFFLYLIPIGFLLTQYTITGYDASAHISEETHGAAKNAARGVWQSIFYSAIIGWLVLLAITFAVQNADFVSSTENGFGVGSSLAIFSQALTTSAFKLLLIICTVGQLFCGNACLTSASRMCFAFSRDGGLGPVSNACAKVNQKRVPFNAVLSMALAALVITIPALWGAPGTVLPFAFYAVVSIAVIGLYIAYAIPIYLRWRLGDAFEAEEEWNLGKNWRWMNPIAVIWVVIMTIAGMLPTVVEAVPWNSSWDVHAANYAPLALLAVILWSVGLWFAGARRTFTGQPHSKAAPPVGVAEQV
ncbi:MAG: amino acid permease [Solirubrobacterales bacterium]